MKTTTRRKEILAQIKTDPEAIADLLVAWETELSEVMPKDFKDWHQNDKAEWPLVAKAVIKSLKASEDRAWKMLSDVNRPGQGVSGW
jgi:hypothetical protein